MKIENLKTESAILETLQELEPHWLAQFRELRPAPIPDMPAMARLWASLLDAGTAIVYRLSEEEKSQGVIMGLIIPDLLIGDVTCTEYLWFVKPESRAYSLDLLGKLELTAKEVGCKRILLGARYFRLDALERLYRTMGYRKTGIAVEKDL